MDAKAIATLAAHAAEAKKGHRVRIIDLSGLTTMADYFVIASADNRIQLRAIADETRARLHEKGIRRHHVEGYAETGWILLDYGDVVVHYFLETQREFYGLERLWGDAPPMDFSADSSVQERG